MTVVTVNDVAISREDVDRALERLLLDLEGQVDPEQVEAMRPRLREQAAENLINEVLLLQEADRQGIRADEAEVARRFEDVAGRFPQAEDFLAVLESMGFSEDGFRRELDGNQRIETLLARETGAPEQATREEVDAFYRDNPESFALQEKVRARHILISSDPDDPKPLRVERRLEASRLRGEIENGEDFAGLASRHSGCPTSAQGGDLGFFERGRMARPFEDAAFDLQPGQTSGIVETQFGYHLIQVTERQEAGVVPLEEAREKIAEFLNARKNMERIGTYLEKLRRKAVVRYARGARD